MLSMRQKPETYSDLHRNIRLCLPLKKNIFLLGGSRFAFPVIHILLFCLLNSRLCLTLAVCTIVYLFEN